MLSDKQILANWYAEVYDQCVTEIHDVNFLLQTLGPKPLRVLEACCGTGRILVPLARAGYNATGFDMNEAMLARINAKAKGLSNLTWSAKDALEDPWGEGFDVVILAGNILLNIETEENYAEAQQLFLRRAYDALHSGGHVYLDFDCHKKPVKRFKPLKQERIIFEGIDSARTRGTYSLLPGGRYERCSQIAFSNRRTKVITKEGRQIIQDTESRKHIPSLKQVLDWLAETGFAPENIWGDYEGNPVSRKTSRAIIWAKKEEHP